MAFDEALAERHVRPMDFTGRPLKGFVFVTPSGIAAPRQLESWVARATAFARSLPPK